MITGIQHTGSVTSSMQLGRTCQHVTAVSRTRQLTRSTEQHWGHATKKETPIKCYLRTALKLRDQVLDTTLALAPNLSDLAPLEVDRVVHTNVQLLGSLAPTQDAVRQIVIRNPGLLAAPLRAWFDFFSEYGLEAQQFWRLLSSYPSLMLQGTVFAAGSAILFLKAIGWSDLEITTIIIPFHAVILQMDVQAQLQPVWEHLLHVQGLSFRAAQQFLHQHPGVLYGSNYKGRIQQLLRLQHHRQHHCL